MEIIWNKPLDLFDKDGSSIPVKGMEMWKNVKISTPRNSLREPSSMVVDLEYNGLKFNNIPTTLYTLQN